MERPNQKNEHPATGMCECSDMVPGAHLMINRSGSFKTQARGSITQAFVFTNHATCYRSSRTTKNKECATLVNELKMWISHTGRMPETLWVRSIRTDNEFMCSPLVEFCRDKGIKLTSCAPHTHQQNPVAESTVKITKRVVRRNEVTARTGARLRALCWKYAGH